MTNHRFSNGRSTLRSGLLAGLMLLFFSAGLSAQSLPDFSGVWEQDVSKSDDFYKDFNVKCTIVQTKQAVTIKTTFADKDGKEMVTRESTFSLDGKVTTDTEDAKKSAKWSPDKKTLITSDTKDYGGDIVGTTAAYTLSAGGLVLTIKTSDIKPGGKTITQVFNKKK